MQAVFIIAIVMVVIQHAAFILGASARGALMLAPLIFPGLLCLQLAALWAGRRMLTRSASPYRAAYLAAWGALVLLPGEVFLPASTFGLRDFVLDKVIFDRIAVGNATIEPLASSPGRSRFVLTYTIVFPVQGRYWVSDALFMNRPGNAVIRYQHKTNPTQFVYGFIFSAGQPYKYSLLIDAPATPEELAEADLEFSIWPSFLQNHSSRDNKRFSISLKGLEAAYADHPPPRPSEPRFAADDIWDYAEKNLRLGELELSTARTVAGAPLSFSFVILNGGSRAIPVPEKRLGLLARVSYAIERVSDTGGTPLRPGPLGPTNEVGGLELTEELPKQPEIPAGARLPIKVSTNGFSWLPTGTYRLRLVLKSELSTEPGQVQELVAPFEIAR